MWVSRAIKAARVVAFEDLGMEAIYEFEVRDMPVTVAVGASTLTRNARSTVGTLSGALPLLRLLGMESARYPWQRTQYAAALEKARGPLSDALCAAFARATREPLNFTRQEWLIWWKGR